jgi:ankyrin repeat protein
MDIYEEEQICGFSNKSENVEEEENTEEEEEEEEEDEDENTEEEEKIKNIVLMFLNKRLRTTRPKYFSNNIKREIAKLSDVNIFINSPKLQYSISLLFYASQLNVPEVIDILLESGADPTLLNNKCRSVLHLMAKHGQVEMAKKCLSKIPEEERNDFINKNILGMGWTPLMAAVENNQFDFVKWFLAPPQNAKVNLTLDNCETAMHVAAKKNNKDIVKLLLAHGGDQYMEAYHRSKLLKVMSFTRDSETLAILSRAHHLFEIRDYRFERGFFGERRVNNNSNKMFNPCVNIFRLVPICSYMINENCEYYMTSEKM